MTAPLVSVIVPVYNVEEYLRQCIESICNQTYKNLEIILVDDGSPDHSPAICDEYAQKDNRIKVIHKENGGLSSARNAGLDIASGEYIGFVDSDDFIEQEMYEKLLFAIQDKDADICFCRVTATTEKGEILPNTRYYGYGDAVQQGIDVIEVLVKGGSTFFESACNKLYRSVLFTNIRFPEGKFHEDAFVMHHIYGLCSRITFVEDALYRYRLRENSIMRQKFSSKRLDVIDAFIARTQYCLDGERPQIAAYAVLQALGKTLEVWMQIPNADKKSHAVIRQKMHAIRKLYERVPVHLLSMKNRAKLFFGMYFTAFYRIKLRLQNLCTGKW